MTKDELKPVETVGAGWQIAHHDATIRRVCWTEEQGYHIQSIGRFVSTPTVSFPSREAAEIALAMIEIQDVE
jgi:hypothetical protein